MEKRMANVEKDMATNMGAVVIMETHMKNMGNRMANVERNTTDMDGKLEAVNNEVRKLKTAFVDGFDEMKNVLVKMDKTEENPRKVKNTASGDKENIIVAGGQRTNSVEMFNWRQRTWSPLQLLPEKRFGAISFVYNNYLTIAGGYSCWSTEIFDDNLLIVGGRTTTSCSNSLSSVVLYDVRKNECQQSLAPLPYEISEMATVRWGDNIVVIGGRDKRRKALDTDIICNDNTEQSYFLTAMRCKRWKCAAVVIENNIVVLGGENEQGARKSVEAFNFERYAWLELSEMSQARDWHTAVVV
ncbi:kelch 41b [Paramuricea clavata]|uniref:Kelch 41b n=1 Tax=Paramuricea clavata TaxID=317549 RepID=A0A7D9I1W4_PARCT|nr:kelch 41b [Paramuricea clavata]